MFHGWCRCTLFLVAVSSAISSTWAGDLPPHFSALTLSSEQNEALAQLSKDHSELSPENTSPKTERDFFNGCWRVLTGEQQLAWSDAAKAKLVVPKEWTELGLSDDQRDLLARATAVYGPHFRGIDQDLRELSKSIEETRKKVLAADASERPRQLLAANTLMRQVMKAAKTRQAWEKALDSEMRGCLTAEQSMRLLVLEAKPLLPKEYAALRLTDEQLARLAPKLKTHVPAIANMKSRTSDLERDPIARELYQESLDKREKELSDAVVEVLTDAQREELKTTVGSR